MQKVTVNGVCYAVHMHQNKPALPHLLMLHGFMGDHRVFDPLTEHLCRICNPVTLDMLGHGASDKITDASRYAEGPLTEDLTELISHLGIAPLFIYGYSMGGRLALRTALQIPEACKGLILESTNEGIEGHLLRKERMRLDRKRADKLLENFHLFLTEWKELDLFKSSVSTDQEAAERYAHIQGQQQPSAIAASLKGFSNGNMQSVKTKLKDFEKPVLLIAGNEDEKYLKINDTMARHFANARLEKLKGGHRVHLDNPQELIKQITQFLEENS